MKRFLFAIIALMAVVNVKGADVTGALTNVADPVITYWSVDAHNNPIKLSAKLYYKNNKNVEFVMINCHPTITHNAGCPSGTEPQMDVVKYMISEGALVVCPDYIGFGETSSTVHPYMCATLTGRNVLDAYKAAIEYVKTTGGRKINSNYYTINVGYSQGGATALAFQRYLETQATDADRKLVNLRGSVCGAGPYDQNIVFDVYENKDGKGFATLDYPIYLLYVLQGHKQAFGETTMRKLELEECFTPDFWAACQGDNGFLNLLNKKETNVDDLNKAVKEAGFTTFYSIINADYANRDSKVYRTIHKTLEQSNLLADGWTPKTPIIFYHDQAGHDIVVPYACTEAALTRFAGHCSYVDAIDDYGYNGTGKVGFFTVNITGENYLWHPAVFHETWNYDKDHPGQETIMALASITGNERYDFEVLGHRTFGARFYAQILGVRRILRPDYDDNGKYPGDNNGTADERNISPATPVTYPIPATAASTADTYDRIEMALPTNMQKGKLTFLQFPAPVDGYYFGADAKRYEVTLNDGEVESYEEMDDLADFEAGKVYLVEAPDDDNVINIVTAAKQKTTIDCNLAWRELNMRKTTTVTGATNAEDGTSFVSNYLPFAYKLVGGAKAYVMKEDSEKLDYLTPSTLDVVPAGTGTIIACEPVANNEETPQNPVIVLEPVTDSGVLESLSPIGDNILTGSYTTIDNEKYDYLHFGLSTENRVGFWSYNMDKVRAYSAFIDMTARQSKGFIIDFQNDATGITFVNENENENIYNIAGQRVNENAKGIIIKNGKKYLVK